MEEQTQEAKQAIESSTEVDETAQEEVQTAGLLNTIINGSGPTEARTPPFYDFVE